MNNKYNISETRLTTDRGFCFICDDCKLPDTVLVQEYSTLKTCAVTGCENATSKSFDLSEQYIALIKEKPEKNPDLKPISVDSITDNLIKEGLLFESGHKMFATYNFLYRYQDILNGISHDNDELILLNENHDSYIDLKVFKSNKIGIEIEFWNREDLSSAIFKQEIRSRDFVEFTFNEVIDLANEFRSGFRDFLLTKNHLQVFFE